MASFSLGSLNDRFGSTGQLIHFSSQGVGFSIAGGVDLNADGTPDIVAGAYDPLNGGALYVIFGRPNQGANTLSPGFKGPMTGYSVAVGNLNGGRPDIISGDPGAAVSATSSNGGIVSGYLDQDSVSLTTTFDNYNLHGGAPLGSSPAADLGDNWGALVSNLGDLNGDGLDEFFISAPGHDSSALGPGSDVGLGYVLYGNASGSYFGMRTSFDNLISGPNGFVISAPNIRDGNGYSAATGGDFNGDGHRDLFLGQSSRNLVIVDLNAAHALGTSIDYSGSAGLSTIQFTDSEQGALFGASVAAVDVNNDGLSDLIIGAPGADGGRGKIYVILGRKGILTGTVDVNNPTAGFTVIQLEGNGAFGRSVASAGDFNADGFADFIVGAPSEGSFGNAYVFFGGSQPAASGNWLLTGSSVLKLSGAVPGTGWAVDRAGDVNNDGVADVLVSAFDYSAPTSSAIYVVYGSRSKVFADPGAAVLTNFNPANGWASQDKYPRHVADVNGDGYADIVGFGQAGTLVAFGSANGTFSAPVTKIADFGQAQGWSSDNAFHRQLIDVNHDGRADIVGFGIGGVLVSLAQADGSFAAPTLGSTNFNQANGWSSEDAFTRTLADVNGDGFADVVGFGIAGTYVALGKGDGTFGPAKFALANFGANQGWTSDNTYHRTVADVNGDGRADVIGFGIAGAYVALGQADGTFAAPTLAQANFGTNQGWSSQDAFARVAGDVNGDGKADVVGFGIAGTYVAYGQADGSFSAAAFDVANFGAKQGWTSDNLLHRELADLNKDGRADIVGFGYAGVYASTAFAG